jgi:hypothetical protein
MAQVAIEERKVTAVAIIAENTKPKRMYTRIDGQNRIVYTFKVEVGCLIVYVWGDDINNLEAISLPLETELTVL